MRPITAADVMNPNVLTVRDDMTVAGLARFLVEHEISGAPVADAEGRLVGVVSVTDVAVAVSERAAAGERRVPGRSEFFARAWEEEGAEPFGVEEIGIGAGGESGEGGDARDGGRTVRDIMTPTVYSVPEDTPVSEVAETMIESHVHRLLVTREGRVVGILSTSDLLGLLVEDEGP